MDKKIRVTAADIINKPSEEELYEVFIKFSEENQLKIHPLAQPFEYIPQSTPSYGILLVHGFTASPTEVKPLGDYLWTEHSNFRARISSILLPGHGISGEDGFKALSNVKWNQWVDAVTKKVDELVSPNYPFFICGLSFSSISEIISFRQSITRAGTSMFFIL